MEDRNEMTTEGARTESEAEEPRAGVDAAAGAPGAAEGEEPAVLQRERDEYRDLLLRKSAEFDNYRKRVERDRRETVRYASSEVLQGLLPILDDFERALRAPDEGSPEGYRRGVELIYKQLVDFLGKHGVTPIEAVGADFDPRYHEAMTYEERPGSRDGEVIEEVRRGYMHGERLLRPAMVKVAKA